MNYYQQLKEAHGEEVAREHMRKARSCVKSPTGFAVMDKESIKLAQLKSAKKRVANNEKKNKQSSRRPR
jgi:hypothetical protein